MKELPSTTSESADTPTTTGDFVGKCYELCGTYHSRMLFNVKVVEQAEYEQYLSDLEDQGNYSEEPLLGGNFVNEQAGLDDHSEEEAE